MRSLLISLLVVVSIPSFADFKCWEKIEDQKQNLAEVEEKKLKGEANEIDVLAAKLSVNQQTSDCGLVAKYNYCYYQSTVMQSMLDVFKEHPRFATPTLNSDTVDKDLKDLKSFCLDAKATHPQNPDESIGQPSEEPGE